MMKKSITLQGIARGCSQMKITKKSIIAGIAAMLVLAGCTNSGSTQQKKEDAKKAQTTTTETKKASAAQTSKYVGKKNLSNLEKQAKSNSKDANAQIEAAKGAYVNHDYKKAISYYKAALKNDPKSAIANNNLGNVYFRGLNKPKDAISFYQKATKLDPKYSFGWWNLALAQQALGQKKEVQATVKEALKHVSPKDPNYKAILKMKK